MRKRDDAGVELMTIVLICPLLGEMAEVTVLTEADRFVGIVGCPLREPGTTCLGACEAGLRRWCEYRGVAA